MGIIGMNLLKSKKVDVNSRDNIGHTILEYLIRQPRPSTDHHFQELISIFFRSDQLDPNLETSSDKSPLELIISLYDTWPAEFGDITQPWHLDIEWYGRAPIVGEKRQQEFSNHLLKILKLLLATSEVDSAARERCLSQAKPPLHGIILNSMTHI